MAPEISVVVPSHDRAMRLLWLLNALEEQSLSRERWEIIVVHDSRDGETEPLLGDHDLRSDGTLRHLRLDPCSPSAKRNAGWREARGPLIAFTDDDCRPHPGWLAALLGAWDGNGSAVIQGRTEPDPYEAHLLALIRHSRSQEVQPPDWYANTCNIAYPGTLLDLVGGFAELGPAPAGEDTDLFLRAQAEAGARITAAPEALVWHAVEPMTLRARLKFIRRWEPLALVAKRHPRVRRSLFLGIFWRRRHALFLLAAVGLGGARSKRPLGLLSLPWLLDSVSWTGPLTTARQFLHLPGAALIDAQEVATLARGSLRYRTLYL